MTARRRGMLARLVGVTPNVGGVSCVLRRREVRIGRDDANDIVLSHHGVSRTHAIIRRDEVGGHVLVDLQSTNGVRVNGNRYGKVALRDGDYIDLGRVRFQFVAARRAR